MFGRKNSPTNQTKNATFFEWKNSPFAATESNTTDGTYHARGSVTCNASSFEGVDPLPGIAKACYCDVGGRTFNDEYVEKIKKYWRSQQAKSSLTQSLVQTVAYSEQCSTEIEEIVEENTSYETSDTTEVTETTT